MVPSKHLQAPADEAHNVSVDASGDKRTPAARRDDEPVLPNTSSDNGDTGWGDDPQSAHRDEDWYRRERPPHHE